MWASTSLDCRGGGTPTCLQQGHCTRGDSPLSLPPSLPPPALPTCCPSIRPSLHWSTKLRMSLSRYTFWLSARWTAACNNTGTIGGQVWEPKSILVAAYTRLRQGGSAHSARCTALCTNTTTHAQDYDRGAGGEGGRGGGRALCLPHCHLHKAIDRGSKEQQEPECGEMLQQERARERQDE